MYLIILGILSVNIFLLLKNKFSFLPQFLRECPLGTWCMYSNGQWDKSLEIYIIDSQYNKVFITDLCLEYFKNNYFSGILTTDAHNYIYPTSYVTELLDYISEKLNLKNKDNKFLILSYSYNFKNIHFIHNNYHKL